MAGRAKPHTWDSVREIWRPHVPKMWDGYGWSRPVGDYTSVRRSPFEPYIGEGTVWTRTVADMPLHTNSAAQAAWMAANINYGSGFGPTTLNTSVGGTHPIQAHLVDSRIPGTNYVHMTCGGEGASGYGAQILSGWVPWPPYLDSGDLQPGQDSSVVIVDIGTGLIREYYLVAQTAGYDNAFTALVGGFSLYERDLTNLAIDNYPTQLHQGSNAVVKMHNWLGWIDIGSARRGEINHAIAFTCANMAVPTSTGEAIQEDGTRYQYTGPSWPAQGGDGDSVPTADDIPIHGQWARLPDTLDLSSTGPYPPFVRMVIQAVQTYGMVCTDSNNFVHAFNAEPGFYEEQWLGVDPWSSGGDVQAQYVALNQKEGRSIIAPFSMASFPWDLTEWAPRNWGKPDS